MRIVLLVVTVALASCALRPRYRDLVSAAAPEGVGFVLLNPESRQPIAGAKVEFSELKNRWAVTSGPDGVFRLPSERKYLDENPVLVVTLPKGHSAYEIKRLDDASRSTEGTDAGVPSNG